MRFCNFKYGREVPGTNMDDCPQVSNYLNRFVFLIIMTLMLILENLEITHEQNEEDKNHQ